MDPIFSLQHAIHQAENMAKYYENLAMRKRLALEELIDSMQEQTENPAILSPMEKEPAPPLPRLNHKGAVFFIVKDLQNQYSSQHVMQEMTRLFPTFVRDMSLISRSLSALILEGKIKRVKHGIYETTSISTIPINGSPRK